MRAVCRTRGSAGARSGTVSPVRLRGIVAGLGVAASLMAAAPAAASSPILSAFFGIDNSLPLPATFLCAPAVLLDGMPVVFRQEIDERTLYPWSFTVTTRSGARRTPLCATTSPANQESEDRTVLLIGELGNDPADPPASVTVTGRLLDEAGHDLRGATAPVVPLAAGPELVYAEIAPPEPDTATFSPLTPSVLRLLQAAPAPCPAGTVQRVRVTWDGGVTAPGGGDGTDAQRRAYAVTMADGRVVVPFALADLGDMDNNHLLCLATAGVPVAVSAAPGLFADPRRDVNPATAIGVSAGE